MKRDELRRKWENKSYLACRAMKDTSLDALEHIRCEQRFRSYGICATSGGPQMRDNSEQARLALLQRGELENPMDKAKWETMVDVYTECADELEMAQSHDQS